MDRSTGGRGELERPKTARRPPNAGRFVGKTGLPETTPSAIAAPGPLAAAAATAVSLRAPPPPTLSPRAATSPDGLRPSPPSSPSTIRAAGVRSAATREGYLFVRADLEELRPAVRRRAG